jgi:hypothetical protein
MSIQHRKRARGASKLLHVQESQTKLSKVSYWKTQWRMCHIWGRSILSASCNQALIFLFLHRQCHTYGLSARHCRPVADLSLQAHFFYPSLHSSRSRHQHVRIDR